jgi:hypothetical protein
MKELKDFVISLMKILGIAFYAVYFVIVLYLVLASFGAV